MHTSVRIKIEGLDEEKRENIVERLKVLKQAIEEQEKEYSLPLKPATTLALAFAKDEITVNIDYGGMPLIFDEIETIVFEHGAHVEGISASTRVGKFEVVRTFEHNGVKAIARVVFFVFDKRGHVTLITKAPQEEFIKAFQLNPFDPKHAIPPTLVVAADLPDLASSVIKPTNVSLASVDGKNYFTVHFEID